MDTSNNELIEVLMFRDTLSIEEVKELIEGAVEDNPHDPEDALYDLGLEPDYIFDIIPFYQ